jgi:hypothetical protein
VAKGKGGTPLEPDYGNTDPLRGLPADFPAMHSRFAVTPVPNRKPLLAPDDDRDLDADRAAWREAMAEILKLATDDSEQ